MTSIGNQRAIFLSFVKRGHDCNRIERVPTKRLLLALAIVAGLSLFQPEARAQHGTLSYALKAVMVNVGSDEDATGTINSTLLRKSNGDNQRLKIVLANLDPETAYQLNAFIGDETVPTSVAALKLDLTTAYNDAAGRTVGAVSVSGNLGGQTLPPGLYKSTSSLEISSGDLTLNAQGDANAVFIFQIASTLTSSSDRKIFLTGNAKAANVFWQVGTSATLGTISIFKGTIMADQSVTLTTGAALEGRALARIGAVTLDSSTVTVPAP